MKKLIILIMCLVLLPVVVSADTLSLFQPGPLVSATSSPYPMIGYTTQSAVNVRQKPAGNAKVVKKISKGTEVTVNGIETVKNVDWYQVTLPDGKNGYIRSDLMTIGQAPAAALASGSAAKTSSNKNTSKTSRDTSGTSKNTSSASTSGSTGSFGSSKSSSSKSSAAAPSSGSGSYIGNKNSRKFHRSNCSTLPKSENRVYFSSRDAAISAGYTPCKKCEP